MLRDCCLAPGHAAARLARVVEVGQAAQPQSHSPACFHAITLSLVV